MPGDAPVGTNAADQPTAAFANPGGYPPAPAPAPAKSKSGRALLIALVGALAVVLIGGGVAFAGFKLGWFGGGGKLPYSALPVASVGYFQVDLNPSVDQKLAALNFYRELPQLKDAQQNPNFDVKEVIWNEWAKDNNPNGLNYATDIKPWLGERYGMSVLPAASSEASPVMMVAIQVTDEKLAGTKLPALLPESMSVVRIADGYAVMAKPDDVAQVSSALAAGTMDKNQAFLNDLAGLGNTGWVAGWADLKGLASLAPSSTTGELSVKGSATVAIRFNGNVAEYAGTLVGVDPKVIPASNGGTDLGDLPADTGFAVSMQGGGAWLKANWDQLSGSLSPVVSSLEGWNLPEDLASVFGNQLTIAVPKDTITQLMNPSNYPTADAKVPTVGAKLNTDSPARVKELLDAADPGTMFSTRLDGSRVTAATDEEYLGLLANNTGAKLSASPLFSTLVPDSTKCSVAVYFDAASLGSDWTSKLGSEASEEAPFLKALTGASMTVTPNGTGASWALRVARS